MHVEALEIGMVRREAVELRHLDEGAPWRQRLAPRAFLFAPVGVDNLGADQKPVGGGGAVGDEARRAARRQQRIGIEEQQEFARRFARADIAGGREADIAVAADDARRRAPAFGERRLDCAVPVAVVDGDDFPDALLRARRRARAPAAAR